MRVYVYPPPIDFPDTPHRLTLEPQSDWDRMQLEKLETRYHIAGMGRRADGTISHIDIELRPLEERDGKAEK